MYIIIIGAGDVGSYVARALVKEGHEVAVVELQPELATRLDASLNALVVFGSGVDPSALRKAGVAQADLLLAVTSTDEVNLIACMTARRYGSERLRAVARVRQSWGGSGDLTSLSAEDLDLDAIINPRQSVAMQATEILRYAGSGEMRDLAEGRVLLIGMVLAEDSPLVHESLEEIRADFGNDFQVVAIQNGQKVRIPAPGDRLLPNDRAFVMTLPENLTELAILSGRPWHTSRRILIVGCGNTGLAVAAELEKKGLSPTIIELDRARAEHVSGLLSNSLVLHGDGSDPEFLRAKLEEGDFDAVVILLENDETSVLLGIFAKSLGATKVLVRCDDSGYIPLAHRLGVDAILSPKRAMMDFILRYVRRGKIESTLLLGEDEVEIIEFKIQETPALPDLAVRPLGELPFPPDSLVGAILRQGKAFLATPTTILKPGDEVFVACGKNSLQKVEKMFS